jgi:hypothetical protein
MAEVAPQSVAMAQDFMKDLNDFRRMVQQLELYLRRQKITGQDENGNLVITQMGAPRMSEEGIMDVLSEIESFLNTNTSYTYTEQNDFNNIMLESSDSFVIRLGLKMKDWRIEPSDFSVLCGVVRNIKEFALRKSIGRNFQMFTSSSRNTTENIILEKSEKTGLLGGIFGQRKGTM